MKSRKSYCTLFFTNYSLLCTLFSGVSTDVTHIQEYKTESGLTKNIVKTKSTKKE